MIQKSFSSTYIFIAPLALIAVTLLFYALARWLTISISLSLTGLGALGWTISLILRIPCLVLLRKLFGEQSQSQMVWLSGPTEELTRAVLVVFAAHTVAEGYALGLGWATIEVLYTIMQMLALHSLQERTDEQAILIKSLIAQQGMKKVLNEENLWWGVAERLSASAIHIGLTLTLVAQPWLALITAPLHSVLNYTAIRIVKHSAAFAELFIFGAALVLFTGGLLLTMR
ncbi:MAG: hypothetical protein KKD01_16320 [Proteobacteria bacterium]|nr:hypothetical protein [Pseudomonadota bacterium]MBU1233165.1 hypothetical protein [Pseudomonadota bacterium]MBU1417569.1 hypothetical protein [Pseudomonadota bacterium]MBU1456290.1 hypothetical protein [Pseudomonadota bacterium]